MCAWSSMHFQQEPIRHISGGTSSTASCLTQETHMLISGPFVYIWARLDENALQFMHLYWTSHFPNMTTQRMQPIPPTHY